MTNLDPLVHVVMAVFQPNENYLSEQIRSIAYQTGVDVTLHFVIADLASGDLVAKIAQTHDLDFHIHVPATKLSAVSAFELGLSEAVRRSCENDFFAFSDQDDVWYDFKLKSTIDLLKRSRQCHVVHTDAQVVDENGRELKKSLFAAEARDRSSPLRRLLCKNSFTGMTMVFTKTAAVASLPFPKQSGNFFYHDLWVALVGEVLGHNVLLKEATVKYRQHGANSIGVVSNVEQVSLFSKAWLRTIFAEYSLASYLAKSIAIKYQAMPDLFASQLSKRKIRQLRPYLRPYSPGATFGVDCLREFARGNLQNARSSFERMVVRSGKLAWSIRRVMSLDLPARVSELDSVGFSISPGAHPPKDVAVSEEDAQRHDKSRVWYSFLDPRKSLPFSVEICEERTETLNILVPTLNPSEIFAGVGTAINFGVRLADAGQSVRFIATDLPMIDGNTSLEFLRTHFRDTSADLGGEKIEVVCGQSAKQVKFSKRDRFMATAWWTAHAAEGLIVNNSFEKRDFLYLIQDFEPGFYAWGDDYAGALSSYDLPCVPIFNTSFLKDYFQEVGVRFHADPVVVFRPSIDVEKFSQLIRVGERKKVRLAVYGRPEVARNMFPLCIEAIAEFVRSKNLTSEDIEVLSVGMRHENVLLPNSVMMKSLGKLSWEDYPTFLSTVDLGLAMMFSPHPSHLPLEMAASGVRTVTNSFGPKDLSSLSPLLYSCDPSAASAAAKLGKAWCDLSVKGSWRDRSIDLSSLGDDIPTAVRKVAATLEERDVAGLVQSKADFGT